MVRHEVRIPVHLRDTVCSLAFQAAEAMGAISAASAVPVLKKYLDDPERAVRETCEIALAKIEWDLANKNAKAENVDSRCASILSPSDFPTNFSQLYFCRSRTCLYIRPSAWSKCFGRFSDCS